MVQVLSCDALLDNHFAFISALRTFTSVVELSVFLYVLFLLFFCSIASIKVTVRNLLVTFFIGKIDTRSSQNDEQVTEKTILRQIGVSHAVATTWFSNDFQCSN